MPWPLPLRIIGLHKVAWAASSSRMIWRTLTVAFFFASMRYPLGPLRAIREFLVEHLGPVLHQCTWYDLALVAMMAGLGEEILFRGLLQPWIGLFASNIVFGVVHSVTPLYAVIAALIGTYLGALQLVTNNLWPPVLAHALYDFVAFLAVADECRGEARQQVDLATAQLYEGGAPPGQRQARARQRRLCTKFLKSFT